MKFLVGKNRKQAVQVARTELLWEQTGQFKLLDLYRDEVTVIATASELRGYEVECVYLLPDFGGMSVSQWDDFQQAFARGRIKTMRVLA